MFREPKFAAYVYSSQCDPAEGVVLQPVTFWARGERNIGGVLPLIILTNCDTVELRYGELTKRAGPDRTRAFHLLHAPASLSTIATSVRTSLASGGMGWEDGLFSPVSSMESPSPNCVWLPIRLSRLEVAADSHTLRASGRDLDRAVIAWALDQAGSGSTFLNDAAFVRVEWTEDG